MCHVSCVTCHMSYVTCHMSRVTCHVSYVKKKKLKNVIKWWSLSVEGLLSTGPTPSSLVLKMRYIKQVGDREDEP